MNVATPSSSTTADPRVRDVVVWNTTDPPASTGAPPAVTVAVNVTGVSSTGARFEAASEVTEGAATLNAPETATAATPSSSTSLIV